MRLMALHLSQSVAYSHTPKLLLIRRTFRWCEMCAAVRENQKQAGSASATMPGVLPTQRRDNCLPFSAASQADGDRDGHFRGGTEAEYLMLFSDEFGKHPRLCICLGISACTSENEAFKGDCENNYIYSQREGDISSFFQGQVPALLRSALVAVAAGECV